MADDLAQLRRNLDTMPEPARQVFERARFRNLDYAAIAAELDIDIPEVERLLARALLHLAGPSR